MDLKDDVLQLLELLWRPIFSQQGCGNVATQFVRNGHINGLNRNSLEYF
jgi:hypothetical protein